MTNTNNELFELEKLCPLLAIMKLEGRYGQYFQAIANMSKAYGKPSENMTVYSSALAYLQSLAGRTNIPI